MLTRLNNGATLLGCAKHPLGGFVVVARTSGPHPFVTWRASPEGDCYWGHYFRTEAEAQQNFRSRQESEPPGV